MNVHPLASKAVEAEGLLKALANRHRLMILCNLVDGEASVSALRERVGLSQSALSQHLARLRDDGLVATRRAAQTIYYRLSGEAATKIMGLLHDLYCAPARPGGAAARKGGKT